VITLQPTIAWTWSPLVAALVVAVLTVAAVLTDAAAFAAAATP